jgi:hypothetical protein
LTALPPAGVQVLPSSSVVEASLRPVSRSSIAAMVRWVWWSVNRMGSLSWCEVGADLSSHVVVEYAGHIGAPVAGSSSNVMRRV